MCVISTTVPNIIPIVHMQIVNILLSLSLINENPGISLWVYFGKKGMLYLTEPPAVSGLIVTVGL